MNTKRRLLQTILLLLLTSVSGRAAAVCQGDFNDDDVVTVDELIVAVQNSLHGCMLPEDRFVDNGDGTITDNLTGLMWEKKVPGTGCLHCVEDVYDWFEAMSDWIALVNGPLQSADDVDDPGFEGGLAGHSDWRVPSLTELKTLPSCVQCPQVILGSEERCSRDNYWSATVLAGSTAIAFSVEFNHGTTIGDLKNGARCVRSVRGVAYSSANVR